MKIKSTKFLGLKVVLSKRYKDKRGFFKEDFKKKFFKNEKFVFGCASSSKKNVIRGLHLQTKSPQGKYVSVLKGAILDVVLDLRKKSKTYKQWSSLEIDSNKRQSIYVPAGCANAFLTLEDNTIVHYYMNDLYNPNTYKGIRYNDPSFSFKWPYEPKIISEKDLNFPDFFDG